MKLTVDNVVATRRRRSAFRIRASAAGSVRAWLLLVQKLITVEVRKPYLTGIGGNKLSDLPVLVIDKLDKGKNKSESNKNTDEHKPSTKTIQNEDIKALEPNPSAVGLLELLDLIDKLDGLIVTNDKTRYTRQTVDREDKEKSAFVPLEMVQVAEPIISTSDKTVNVNLKFKKLGFVYVDGTPVPSFMWREKSIFSNGKPNLDKFSVALTKDSAITLFKMLIPPLPFGKQLYCALPTAKLAMSLLQIRCIN